MSKLKLLEPIVHFCDSHTVSPEVIQRQKDAIREQSRIHIYCSQEWTSPEWGSDKSELVSSDIFIAKNGNFYTFGMSNVNCQECLNKRNLKEALE